MHTSQTLKGCTQSLSPAVNAMEATRRVSSRSAPGKTESACLGDAARPQRVPVLPCPRNPSQGLPGRGPSASKSGIDVARGEIERRLGRTLRRTHHVPSHSPG